MTNYLNAEFDRSYTPPFRGPAWQSVLDRLDTLGDAADATGDPDLIRAVGEADFQWTGLTGNYLRSRDGTPRYMEGMNALGDVTDRCIEIGALADQTPSQPEASDRDICTQVLKVNQAFVGSASSDLPEPYSEFDAAAVQLMLMLYAEDGFGSPDTLRGQAFIYAYDLFTGTFSGEMADFENARRAYTYLVNTCPSVAVALPPLPNPPRAG